MAGPPKLPAVTAGFRLYWKVESSRIVQQLVDGRMVLILASDSVSGCDCKEYTKHSETVSAYL